MEHSDIKKLYYNSIFDMRSIMENICLVVLSAIGFFLPFILGHPQILVGTIVNSMLIIGATYLKGHKILPLILLPSSGVLTAGILFGTYTPFILYLIPLIWLSNALYVYTYKYFNMNSKKFKNNILGVGVASVLKAALLSGVTLIMVKMSLLPSLFLAAMGILQLTTAIMGGLLAVGVVKLQFSRN